MLDPDIVFRSDAAAIRTGGPAELRGAEAVAASFKGRAQAALPILVDGSVGVLVAPRGQLRLVLRLSFAGAKISEIEAIADPVRLATLELGIPWSAQTAQ